jgi:hypothetical protein
MPIFGTLAATVLLLSICSFFPGYLLLRRLRWTPLEKLGGSVGLSLILVYVAVWAVFCFGPQNQRPAYWAIAGASALAAVLSARDAAAFFRTFRVRQTLTALLFLLAWTLAMLGMIRVYSGAGWSGDWAEHFQRSLFFLDRLPAATQFIEIYALPARPPMQNVLAAFFLGLTTDRFEVFQTTFGFQNLLMFLPCVLLMPALGFRKRRALIPLVALFAANPAVMQNVTYTWTKALTAFYVILAIAFYLAGWRKHDRTRVSAAFLALAAGVLVHYSAGPYAIVLGLHYLVHVFRERRWRDIAIAVAPAILLLATWFGWSFKVYGAKTTLASNTSISTAEKDPGKNFQKIAANVFDTIVPAWVRGAAPSWEQPNADGRLRDHAFAFYQLNLIFALGVVGGPLALWLLYRRLIHGEPQRERLFWRILIPACIAIGIAVVGERDRLGVSHLTLLALQAAGLTMIASAYPNLHAVVRLAIVAGCCVDFGLGVFLHARVESLENTARATVFPEVAYQGGGRFGMAQPFTNSLSENAWRNWALKRRDEVFARWLGDGPYGHTHNSQVRIGSLQIHPHVRTWLQGDAAAWGGWRGRHGGALDHLGDRVAGQSGVGTNVATAVFLALFAGCMWLFARQALTSRTPAPAMARGSGGGSRRGAARTSARGQK